MDTHTGVNPVTGASVNTHTDDTVAPEVRYSYFLRAYNENGNSGTFGRKENWLEAWTAFEPKPYCDTRRDSDTQRESQQAQRRNACSGRILFRVQPSRAGSVGCYTAGAFRPAGLPRPSLMTSGGYGRCWSSCRIPSGCSRRSAGCRGCSTSFRQSASSGSSTDTCSDGWWQGALPGGKSIVGWWSDSTGSREVSKQQAVRKREL